MWDAATGGAALDGPREGHSEKVWSVALSPNGSKIASGGVDNTVRVWEAATGKRVLDGPLEGHNGTVWSVAWSPDGSKIASGSRDNTVRVWVRQRENLRWMGR